jgi:predicted transcriptional regulator
MHKVVITMEDYQKIRYMFLVEHMSQRQIAKELGISRNTVAKYCDGDTYPGQRSPYHRDAGVVTPDVIAFIQSCLQEDAQEPNRKQHHTARRIFERLVDELDSSTTPVLL